MPSSQNTWLIVCGRYFVKQKLRPIPWLLFSVLARSSGSHASLRSSRWSRPTYKVDSLFFSLVSLTKIILACSMHVMVGTTSRYRSRCTAREEAYDDDKGRSTAGPCCLPSSKPRTGAHFRRSRRADAV